MRTPHGYGVATRQRREPRPAGVTILATLGVLASLATILYSLVKLIGMAGGGVQPSRQLAALGIALVVALVVLWINWGFWELIRWAWWANLVTTLLAVAALIAATRYVPELADLVGRLWKSADPRQVTTAVLAAIGVGIAYMLIAAMYMIGVHALYKVGVKDDRPLWERVQRR
jgi:hypothetical protein